MDDAEPREVPRLLMEQNSLRQKDLAGELGSHSRQVWPCDLR